MRLLHSGPWPRSPSPAECPAPTACRSTRSRSARSRSCNARSATRRSTALASGFPPLRKLTGRAARRRSRAGLHLQRLAAGPRFLWQHLLRGDNKRVLVEAPTYDRPLKILTGLGAEIEGIPMDDDGLDLRRSNALSRTSLRSCTRSRPSRTRVGGRSRSSGAKR